MCGIIWAKRLDGKPAKKSIRKRYENQKSRGTQGYGFVEIMDDKESGVKNCVYLANRAECYYEIEPVLEGSESTDIFFHHRTPTSTPNLVEATHPILVQNNKLMPKYCYYVTHNGMIRNADELKKKFEEEGYIYTTAMEQQIVTREKSYAVKNSEKFNDSESLAIDVAKMIEALEQDKEYVMQSTGSIAFMALQFDGNTSEAKAIYFARNNYNPLKLDIQKERIIVASEGHGVEVKAHTLYKFDYSTNEVTEVKPLAVGWGVENEYYKSRDKKTGATTTSTTTTPAPRTPNLITGKVEEPPIVKGFREYMLEDKEDIELRARKIEDELGFRLPYSSDKGWHYNREVEDNRTDEEIMQEADVYFEQLEEERLARIKKELAEEMNTTQEGENKMTKLISVKIPESNGRTTTRIFMDMDEFDGAYIELQDEKERCKQDELFPAMRSGDHEVAIQAREYIKLIDSEINAYDEVYKEVYANRR